MTTEAASAPVSASTSTSSRFVAVGPAASARDGAAGVDAEGGASRAGLPQRRAMQRRLRDAARRALVDARRTLVALALLVLLALAALAAFTPRLLSAATGLDLLGSFGLLGPFSPFSRSGGLPSGAPLPHFLPELLPLLVPCLVAAVVGVAAVAAAAVLAPLRKLALASAALPLAPLLVSALGGGLSGAPAASVTQLLVLPCALASALAVLLALAGHRRWRQATRLGFEQADQLNAALAARDAALKADQDKSRFLAIASHDLRQPVHAIGLFAATLERRLDGSVELPLVRNLSRAIDGLDRSFNVLLDISQLDAGAIEPQVQHFALRDLFRRLHMHYAGQAEQKGLGRGLRFAPGGKSISSDPQLLERILGNLVQNAIKYTERGGVVVVARSTAEHINVEVWDTGIGIRAADLPKVFDEFYQAGHGERGGHGGHAERVRTQGQGMGLAIVRRLVRLLGHELTVWSRPGCGTMFRVRIARGGLAEIQDLTVAADTLPMPITLLQLRTVLVIDDEAPIRDGLCMLLEEWGFAAIAAESIDAAERAVLELAAPPDLILSDLHLGDGPDGIAAIEVIRRRCGRDIAAILISGDTSPTELQRASASGHPLLLKPVPPRKLYEALRGFMA